MSRQWGWLFAIVIILATFAFALLSPGSIADALDQFGTSFRRSPGEPNATLLEPATAQGTIEAASRRLLRPFGKIRAVRLLPVPRPIDDSKK